MTDFQEIMLAKAKMMTTIFMKNNLEGESWAKVYNVYAAKKKNQLEWSNKKPPHGRFLFD